MGKVGGSGEGKSLHIGPWVGLRGRSVSSINDTFRDTDDTFRLTGRLLLQIRLVAN
jgi:hypothetical protein